MLARFAHDGVADLQPARSCLVDDGGQLPKTGLRTAVVGVCRRAGSGAWSPRLDPFAA